MQHPTAGPTGPPPDSGGQFEPLTTAMARPVFAPGPAGSSAGRPGVPQAETPGWTPDADRRPEENPLVAIDGWIGRAPPWLLSAAIHLGVLILLAVWWSGQAVEAPLVIDAAFAEDLGEQLLAPTLDLDTPLEVDVTDQALSPALLPPVPEPLALPVVAPPSPAGLAPLSDTAAEVNGRALSGREPGSREALLKAFGGTASTEKAVLAGLAWLARQQKSSGEWSLRGPYKDGSSVENVEAATAMALLAFQGHGHTHRGGANDKYARVVRRGKERLLRSQDEDGGFFRGRGYNHRFYTHAQCTIALCELYGMTRDKELRRPAQRAVDYLVRTQHPGGGWRYSPGQQGDLSVTGWVVMALQSARMGGIQVKSGVFERVESFLDSVSVSSGAAYAYIARAGASLPMTAEGLLCRQYLGWRRSDQRLQRGADTLIENPVRWRSGRNIYYWYYATQVCHHMEGQWWDAWNGQMRQVLPANQVSGGREQGSWDPVGDRYGNEAGRLYQTCLAIYCLEVYYRHLPIYRSGIVEGELFE